MTHDELVAVLNDYDIGLSNGMVHKDLVFATAKSLRAVVELHKPDESDFPDEWESCVECSGNGYVAMYPCETIKVIEKELG
jgi:hypothetical protein